mmetsp:Transcript_7568/g.20488  ORF Transcript_7568/g.20488 Transcript_7568/m.20488 type:complete len:258 (+) Transcript_7568:732-1505(+)
MLILRGCDPSASDGRSLQSVVLRQCRMLLIASTVIAKLGAVLQRIETLLRHSEVGVPLARAVVLFARSGAKGRIMLLVRLVRVAQVGLSDHWRIRRIVDELQLPNLIERILRIVGGAHVVAESFAQLADQRMLPTSQGHLAAHLAAHQTIEVIVRQRGRIIGDDNIKMVLVRQRLHRFHFAEVQVIPTLRRVGIDQRRRRPSVAWSENLIRDELVAFKAHVGTMGVALFVLRAGAVLVTVAEDEEGGLAARRNIGRG